MKLLLIMMAALMLPIVPALACFPENDETERIGEGAHGGRSFTREPIPMSFCESGERNFVVVNGKCYDQDAITDFDTEEECQADEICRAYWEEQSKTRNPEDIDICKETPTFPTCYEDAFAPPTPEPEPIGDCSHEGDDVDVCRPVEDPNHGEIKGDEELAEEEQNEEEHQEEEEQGQEESKETTAETVE